MVLPVIMYTIRVQPYRRLNTEEWMILNWDSQESLGLQDQTRSILKEINPEYSLEGLMMKLKFQYFGHLMWRADSLEKTLVLGTTEDKRKGWQRMRRLDGINSMDISLSKFWEIVKYRWAWHAVVHRVTNSQNDLVAEWQPGYNQISCKPLTAAYFSLFMWKLVSQVTYLLSVAAAAAAKSHQ